ncbi:hypothetical protein RG47T_2696 [Mucilaginibacter polytrichastri]|uniref:Uncharacterized protein n=1 Tax=Mucilaginibacter polytrichastri TaxID=1302689 RepID=A0A1Q5ZZR7_9SPHI|nr:hypothetical protein RG47T_2696 [Mucilaginibacter polytrichastri]
MSEFSYLPEIKLLNPLFRTDNTKLHQTKSRLKRKNTDTQLCVFILYPWRMITINHFSS